jgi:CRP-like cAMP-binding protein
MRGLCCFMVIIVSMYELLRKSLSSQAELTDEQFDQICKKFRFRKAARNEILVHAGEICPYIFFVNKGILRVFLLDEDGKEYTRFLMFEGKFGTAFPSFVLQEPSLASVQSLEHSEILYLGRKDWMDFIDNVPGWAKAYRMSIERDYIASIKRIESLIALNAKQRYEQLMADQPEMIQRLPAKIIADYLGISQETLSRLRAKN